MLCLRTVILRGNYNIIFAGSVVYRLFDIHMLMLANVNDYVIFVNVIFYFVFYLLLELTTTNAFVVRRL